MSAAKVRVLALALLAAASADRLRAQPFPPPVASYQITCRLDTEKKTVEGTEVLAWKNTTPRPAATLRFHLYLNAFRNTLSTFWRESGGEHRDGVLPDSWGSIEISRMTGPDGADLLPAMRFVAPDDGNANDRTVAEVILPRPVQPGETISVAMDFVSVLPRVSVRTGYKDDFFMVVQWFPKIGVFEEKGWNCHQFHASTEFFSDFGNYDVSIDVPARYRGKVGATGQRVDERETSAGRILYRFRQQGVHDFAWTADPSYLVLVDAFREAGLGDVQLLLYLQPEHASQAERYFNAAKAALSGYGRVLGGYPYATLSIVDPPWGAHGAGGMEYPTLITGGTAWSAPRSIHRPEGVTVHEAGHQFFYGLLASNEFEEAWLDEGFNTYMTDRVMNATYGPNHVDLGVFGLHFPLGIDIHYPVDTNRRYFEVADWDVLASEGWKFRNRRSYGSQIYSKTALTMATLERLLGTPAMDKALRLYADRWRFRHPDDEGLHRGRQRLDRRGLDLVLRPDLLLLGHRGLRGRRGREQAGRRPARPLREGRQACRRARRPRSRRRGVTTARSPWCGAATCRCRSTSCCASRADARTVRTGTERRAGRSSAWRPARACSTRRWTRTRRSCSTPTGRTTACAPSPIRARPRAGPPAPSSGSRT